MNATAAPQALTPKGTRPASAKTAGASSKLLSGKPDAEILNPKPLPFVWRGETYHVRPMPDSVLMDVGASLAGVTELFDRLVGVLPDLRSLRDEDGGGAGGSYAAYVTVLLPLLPTVVRLLLPNASRVIAGCLGIEEETVATEMYLADKLEALALVVKSEDLPRIAKNFLGLTQAFAPPAPAPSAPTAP